MVPALQPLAGEIDDTVEGPVACRLVAADEGFAARHVAWPEAADIRLVRLVQGHRLEPGGGVELGAGPHDGDGSLDLGSGQRIQRMVVAIHGSCRKGGDCNSPHPPLADGMPNGAGRRGG